MKFKDFFNKEKLKDWFDRHADTPRGAWALGFISFFEAIIFPIPPDFFLMAILAGNNARRWAWWALVTSVGSVLGGLVSYGIGYLFFDSFGQKIIETYNIGDQFAVAQKLFTDNAFWAVLVSAVTPLPDKLFNLVAGLFKVNPLVFLLAYVIARSTRFFLVAGLMKLFGARIARMLYKHLSILSILLLVVIITIIAFLFII